jgi:hypothetical protein
LEKLLTNLQNKRWLRHSHFYVIFLTNICNYCILISKILFNFDTEFRNINKMIRHILIIFVILVPLNALYSQDYTFCTNKTKSLNVFTNQEELDRWLLVCEKDTITLFGDLHTTQTWLHIGETQFYITIIRFGTKETCSSAKEIESGTRETRAGTKEIKSGTKEIESGTKEIESGDRETRSGTKEIESGDRETRSGTKEFESGGRETQTGILKLESYQKSV